MVRLDKGKFQKTMKRFVKACDESISGLSRNTAPKVTRAVAVQTLNAIIANHRYPGERNERGDLIALRDPVDTGRLRYGWGLAGKELGLQLPPQPSGPWNDSDGRMVEKKSFLTYRLTLSNAVDYVYFVEFGTDKMPARTPVTRALETVAKIIQEQEPAAEAVREVADAFRKQGFQVYTKEA